MKRARKQEPGRDVLVALLPRPSDLELARAHGVYRIRSQEAAERLHGGLSQFSDIAFYQPDSFGDARRCVLYTAPITGWGHSRRIDLIPDEPAHARAHELYLRVDLGPLAALTQPIPSARGRRILFIPTSWEKIATAKDVNDLFVGSPLEDRLYRRLRELELLPEREYHVELRDPLKTRTRSRHYFLDMALLCQQRNLDVECDGDTWHANPAAARKDNERDNLLQSNLWHVMRFNTAQLGDGMHETLAIIRDTVNRYGGVVQPDATVRRFDALGHLAPGQTKLDL